jgi:hypothetical protein
VELCDAIAIVTQRRPELILQEDHICGEASNHDLNSCPYGTSAVYTAFDALNDTAETLTARLSSNPARLKRT